MFFIPVRVWRFFFPALCGLSLVVIPKARTRLEREAELEREHDHQATALVCAQVRRVVRRCRHWFARQRHLRQQPKVRLVPLGE